MRTQMIFCLMIMGLVAQAQLNVVSTFPNAPYALLNTHDNLYVGLGGGGVFMSSDSGFTWSPVNQGIQFGGAYIFSLTERNDSIYAGGFGEVNFTNDGGQNWELMGLNKDLNANVNALLLKDSYLFAGTKSASLNSHTIFRKKLDESAWEEISSELLLGASVNALSIKGGYLFAGTNRGVFSSNNNGESWSAAGDGLSQDVMSLIVANNNLVAGTQDGVYVMKNNGDKWEEATGFPDSTVVVSLAINNHILLAGTYDGVYYSSLSGLNWKRLEIENEGTTSYYCMASIGDYIYFGTGGGISSYTLLSYNTKALSVEDERFNTPLETKFYPNPFNEIANFSFGKDLTNAQLNIYNLAGQKVRSVSNISGDYMIIYRGELKPGVYILQLLENNQNILTQKVHILD
jgi:photosystem II stability/assembly factor-like uncharacterized protein